MVEWEERELGSVCAKVVTGGTPLTKIPEYYTDGEIPWLKTKEVNFCRINTTEHFISELGLANSSAKLVPANSVIVAMYGQGDTAGRVAINKIPLTTNQACCNLVIDDSIADYQFIYYLLKNSYIALVQRKTGSAQPNLNTKIIKDFGILLPPLEEQKAITAVLAALDDKIDLLHRQNQTLEALAQTLFRHWFIDGADDDWEEGCLVDISDNIRDSINHDKIPNGTIYIGLEHIDKKNIALNRYGLSDDVQSNKYQFVENDILFGKLRPYFHKVCFSPFSGVCSTDILVLRPKKPHYFCFSLFAFFQSDVVEYANLGSGGTRMPRTNWETLKQYPFQIPPENLIKQFDELVFPSIAKIKQNLLQIRTLENLRDTLLPKLMSGEVRINL